MFFLALTINLAAKAQTNDLGTAAGQLYNSIANPMIGGTSWTNKVINQESKGVDLAGKGDEAYGEKKYKKALNFYNRSADHLSTSTMMYKDATDNGKDYYKQDYNRVMQLYNDVLNKISLTNKMLSGGS